MRMVIVHHSTLTQQHDIEALMEEVKLLKENLQPAAKVAELKKSFSTPASSLPYTLHHVSRVEEGTTITQTNDIFAQAINTMPKTLEWFWKQMNEGDNTLCKFSQVPEKYKQQPNINCIKLFRGHKSV